MYAALPTDYNIVGRGGSRGKSLESLEDAPLAYPPSPAPSVHPQPMEWRPRSFEDGDLTPTNDTSVVDAAGGTLPRPRHCLVRPRPVAKVMLLHACSLASRHDATITVLSSRVDIVNAWLFIYERLAYVVIVQVNATSATVVLFVLNFAAV